MSFAHTKKKEEQHNQNLKIKIKTRKNYMTKARRGFAHNENIKEFHN